MHITTPRLMLRTFALTDAGDCFAFLSDAETCRLDGGYPPYTAMDAPYQALMAQFALQPGRTVVVLKETGRVIGMVHVMPDEQGRPDTVELGYVSSPHCRRRGYMSEAVMAVADELFATGTKCITLGIALSNVPSICMAEKMGFVRVGDYPPVAGEPMALYELHAKGS